LDNEVKVGSPAFAKAVKGLLANLPEARIASSAGVTAADTDIDVLDGSVPQTMVFRQFVQVFHVSRCLMI
jgi:hypothetical protein